MEYRTCRICKDIGMPVDMVHYAKRHYAHPSCLIKDKGPQFLTSLYNVEIIRHPTIAVAYINHYGADGLKRFSLGEISVSTDLSDAYLKAHGTESIDDFRLEQIPRNYTLVKAYFQKYGKEGISRFTVEQLNSMSAVACSEAGVLKEIQRIIS